MAKRTSISSIHPVVAAAHRYVERMKRKGKTFSASSDTIGLLALLRHNSGGSRRPKHR